MCASRSIGGRAHNVILLIGDGMGDSEITIARNYAEGAAGRFAGIDALPLTGQYTTYSLDKTDGQAGLRPRLGGDRHGVGDRHQDLRRRDLGRHRRAPRSGRCWSWPRPTGLRTGNVTTAEIQDATPAVQDRTCRARSCYGPDRHAEDLPEARAGERRARARSPSSSSTPAPTSPWAAGPRRSTRSPRAGRVPGQDAAGAGEGARLPGRHRQGGPRRREARQPERAVARPVRPRQHARPLDRPGSDRDGGTKAAGGLHRQTRPDSAPSRRSPR